MLEIQLICWRSFSNETLPFHGQCILRIISRFLGVFHIKQENVQLLHNQHNRRNRINLFNSDILREIALRYRIGSSNMCVGLTLIIG
jgi:hypothetical protein